MAEEDRKPTKEEFKALFAQLPEHLQKHFLQEFLDAIDSAKAAFILSNNPKTLSDPSSS